MDQQITLVWHDKTVRAETVDKSEFLKMFPELEIFMKHFEPVNLHITFQDNRLLTVCFHKKQ